MSASRSFELINPPAINISRGVEETGVEPRAVARLLEYRGEHVRHGAVAVGAGHVDREIVALGIAQVLAECGCLLYTSRCV